MLDAFLPGRGLRCCKVLAGTIVAGLIVLGLSTAAGESQDKRARPAEEFKVLVKEFEDAGRGLRGREDVGIWYQRRYKIGQKFLELAEKYPDHPVALDSLIKAVWQGNDQLYPVALVGKESARVRGFDLLQRDHVRSDKLGLLCEHISYGYAEEYEVFLRTVLKTNLHKEVQAQACLGLARFLKNRLQRLDLIKDGAERAKQFEELFGKGYLDKLQQQDQAKVIKEVEILFEQAAEKYGDMRIRGMGVQDGAIESTVGEKAKSALFEIRHLSIGKAAPDIDGQDQDGKAFKLSDYRGKVVLLDFWSEL